MRGSAAVVCTHDRPGDFQDCLEAIWPQVDRVVVVSHRAPYIPGPARGEKCTVLRYDADVPNISTMWNMGIEAVDAMSAGPYDVAILNDDAIVPDDWFGRVTSYMRAQGAAAGCVYRPWDSRMTGYAFILDGDKGLRCDEQFQWWYGDTDLERQAEARGGVAFAEGADVEHRHPNGSMSGDPVLAMVAAEDGHRYREKWG